MATISGTGSRAPLNKRCMATKASLRSSSGGEAMTTADDGDCAIQMR